MVAEGILDYCDKKYAITDKGENYLRSEIENLKLILSYLTDSETVSNDKIIPKKILVTLNSIIGLKTIPYDASILINQSGSEEKFFELKENGIYHFDGRGLGKTLARESNDEYDYTRHAALFISNGIIRFVGLISSYCNASKDMKMNEIIQLSKPISVFDIRNHVKQNFNQSQQKQGFYDNDAKKFVELIKLHY